MKKYIMSIFTALTLFVISANNVYAESFTCEAAGGTKFDVQMGNMISTVILLIQIAVPILLVIYGSLDLMKGVMAQKEDEIKKGQQLFMKRLIPALLVFFVIAVVKFSISMVAKNSSGSIFDCVNCFVQGPDDAGCK